MLEVAREYDFERKLHCFVGDNATSNDNQFIKGLNESPQINFGSENRISSTWLSKLRYMVLVGIPSRVLLG